MLNEILKKKESVFTSSGENVKIDSIMLENNGQTQEHFFKEDYLHEMRSLSKIFVALAFGIAIDRKFLVNGKPLTLETKIFPTIKHLAEIKTIENLPKIEKWTVGMLLKYSAGYEKQIFSRKEIAGMDEKKYVEYILNYPIKFQPNEKYVYNNADIFLLSVFFQEAFGMNLTDFVESEIFRPLGIENFVWNNYDKYCPGGTGLCISHHDLFKVGQMMLRGGETSSHERIVSKEWIEAMCKVQMKTPYAVKLERVLPKIGVGFVMHISRNGFAFKDGTNGQYFILNLKENLLITILSSEKDMSCVTEILRGVI